jgi:hypothetical protein
VACSTGDQILLDSNAAVGENFRVAARASLRALRDRVEAEFAFLVADHGCRTRGRFVPGGMELFYWNTAAGVRVSTQAREEFAAHLCPWPEADFPPRIHGHDGRLRRIEWFDALDAVKLVTGRRPKFTTEELFGNDPAVIAAYASALRGPCQPLLHGDQSLWPRLRRQRTARIARNERAVRGI